MNDQYQQHQCPVCGNAMHVAIQRYPPKYKIQDRVEVTCLEDGCKAQHITATPEYLIPLLAQYGIEVQS